MLSKLTLKYLMNDPTLQKKNSITCNIHSFFKHENIYRAGNMVCILKDLKDATKHMIRLNTT